MNRMKKIDRKIELIKQYQEIIDKRNEVDAEFERLTMEGEYKKACELYKTLDNQAPFRILEEIDRLDRDSQKDQDAIADACEHIGQAIGDFLTDFTKDMQSNFVCINNKEFVETCNMYSQSLSDVNENQDN